MDYRTSTLKIMTTGNMITCSHLSFILNVADMRKLLRPMPALSSVSTFVLHVGVVLLTLARLFFSLSFSLKFNRPMLFIQFASREKRDNV